MYLIKLLLLGLFVSTSLAYELKIDKIFEESLEPDKMQLHFSLIAKKKSANETKELLHSAIKKVKANSECKGGAYTLNPQYNYKSDKKELLNFVGKVNFECKFKKSQEIDGLITFFDMHKEIQLQQSPIVWIVEKEKIEAAKLSLELNAISYAKEYITILKKKSVAKCYTKNIDIHTNSYIRNEAQVMLMAKSFIEPPTKESSSINISANYTFECQ